jgi:hypothetical protein
MAVEGGDQFCFVGGGIKNPQENSFPSPMAVLGEWDSTEVGNRTELACSLMAATSPK